MPPGPEGCMKRGTLPKSARFAPQIWKIAMNYGILSLLPPIVAVQIGVILVWNHANNKKEARTNG